MPSKEDCVVSTEPGQTSGQVFPAPNSYPVPPVPQNTFSDLYPPPHTSPAPSEAARKQDNSIECAKCTLCADGKVLTKILLPVVPDSACTLASFPQPSRDPEPLESDAK